MKNILAVRGIMPHSPLYKRSAFTTVLIAFFLLSSFEVPAQNTLDLTGLSSSAPSSAAYSMRKLSSSYSGYALRIRRSSDNAVLEIGFTAGGNLDTAALKTFVGAGNGYVHTWYDQSGNNRNLTQGSSANQPALVTNGIINRENNQPFIRFWGVVASSFNSLDLAANMTTVGHVSAVIRFVSGGHGFILSSGGAYNWHSNSPNYLISSPTASASVSGGSAWQNGAATTPSTFPWPTTLTLAELAPSNPSSGAAWNNLGNDRSCCHFLTGGSGYSELILFNTAVPVTDRQAMETSQMNYFSLGILLPVSWLSISAQVVNSAAVIKWQTASEQNTSSFTIQRSIDRIAWSDLASLPAAGFSNEVRNYIYEDRRPRQGDNYYRIKQTDADGKSTYSIVKTVRFSAKQFSFEILDNPVTGGQLRLQVNGTPEICLYNSTGKMIWKKEFTSGLHNIFTSSLPPGIYLLKAQDVTRRVLIP